MTVPHEIIFVTIVMHGVVMVAREAADAVAEVLAKRLSAPFQAAG
jgi:TRAP-type C4-dicarboxylate transport system permease small subunit